MCQAIRGFSSVKFHFKSIELSALTVLIVRERRLHRSMFPSLTMPVLLRELAKPHVMWKNAIFIILTASFVVHSLGNIEGYGAHGAHSTGGEDVAPLCQMIHEPACKCDGLQDLPSSCSAYCNECVIPSRASKSRRCPTHDAPWDRNYMNLYTPMPDGGLVVSDDGMHVDLKITSPNQTFGHFQSKNRFIFGYYSMYLKLIPKESAGVVATYYFSSPESQPKASDRHDEIDFEFLGNTSGNPIIVQTNVFVNGEGNREQHHYLPFDPRNNFHKYSVLWNQHLIIWFVDDKPIRVFHNKSQEINVPYPVSRPMAIQCSIWDGSDWATERGRVKMNYTNAPFVAQYEGFDGVDGCAACPAVPQTACDDVEISGCSDSAKYWFLAQKKLTKKQMKQLKKHRSKYVVYDYCTDTERFPSGLPCECPYNSF